MRIKSYLLSALVMGLLVFSFSCKKNTDLYWISWGECNISYNVPKNLTSIRISFELVNLHNVDARIVDWKFIIKSRKTQLLEINSGNHQAYAPFVEYDTLYHIATARFVLQTGNPRNPGDSRPYSGHLFPSYAPDNADVFVTITDVNGVTETIDQNLLVNYSRSFDEKPVRPFPHLNPDPSLP